MLIETQYPDHNGSVCPFCGQPLMFSGNTIFRQNRKHYKCKMFPCVCPNKHICFVTVEEIQENVYEVIQRVFVHYQDWEDHIDMTIQEGPYEIPHLDDEDDAWYIHLTALRSYNDTDKENTSKD